MATEPVRGVAPARRFELNPRPADLGGGWQVKLYEGDTECGGGVFPPDAETDPDGSWAWTDAYAMGSEWAGPEVEEPAEADPSTIVLSIALPEPVPGDPFTYCASGVNAAIATAAAMESVDPQQLTDLMSAGTAAADYQLLKQCFRADMKRIQTEEPVDAAEREEFLLDLYFFRMFFSGIRYVALPKEARRAA